MRIKLFMIAVLLYHSAISQSCSGFEEYYYAGDPMASALVTRAWYQSEDHWYGEIRYDYEYAGTYSLLGGRNFSKNGNLSWSVTAFGGLVMGRYKGGSAGVNADLKWSEFFFSSDSQLTLSADNMAPGFFYSWSELGYQFRGSLFAGLALQQTRSYPAGNKWEPGIQAGISFKRWSLPLYVFDPAGKGRCLVLAIIWEGCPNSSTRSTEKL